MAASARDRRPVAALMLDIDHLKKINDTYGHAVGDAVARRNVRPAMLDTARLGRAA